MARRAFNLPNMLTYGRILAVPLVVLCFFLEGRLQSSDFARWSALVIFVAASITDYFDGYLARAWKQTSNIGRMLDPIADKLLVATCLLLLAADTDRTIAGWSLWAAIIILCREILVSGPARISGRAEGQRAGDAARQVEDDDPDGRHRRAAGRPGARQDHLATRPRPALRCCGSSALVTLYTGYDYFRAGAEAHHGRVDAMKLVYFAWVRERIGKAEEEIDAARRASTTVADLLALAEGARRRLCSTRCSMPKVDPRRARPGACRARRAASPARARSRSFRR